MNVSKHALAIAKGLLLASLFLGLNNELLAQRPGGFGGDRQAPHRGHFFNIERHAEELGLTEEQLNAIKEERFKSQKETIQLRSEIKIAQLELRQMMAEANPDRAKVTAQVERIGELRTQLKLTRVYSQLAVKSALTREQIEKLQTLRPARFKERQKEEPSRDRFRRNRKF